jgi:phage-related tail protein
MHDFQPAQDIGFASAALQDAKNAIIDFRDSLNAAARITAEMFKQFRSCNAEIKRIEAMRAQMRLKLHGKNWRAVKLPSR